MSQENVALVRRCIETFNDGDVQAILDLLDEVLAVDAEMRATGRLPDGDGPVTGREAIKDVFRAILGTLAYRTDADEYIDAGDAVVVVCRQTARGKSGAEAASRMVEVFGVHDGMVTYFDAYRTKRDALEAVGRPE